MIIRLILIGWSFGVVFASTGHFAMKNDSESKRIQFSIGEFSIETKSGDSKIVSDAFGTLSENGAPELPVYSTFYQLNPGKDIEVNMIVNESHVISDIILSPSQIIANDDEYIEKNINIYNSNSVYPEQNVTLSQPMVMRGIELVQISVTPYKYNPTLNELEIYDDIELVIQEVDAPERNIVNVPRSRLFDQLMQDQIVNYEISTRNEDYQTPAILYICGGSSLNHPFVQDLIEWRHKMGYIVYAVSTSETGGSSSSAIKNYLENAYASWENPPEIVGFIGDTGGSYGISTYNESWSGYYGAGDFPYCQLDGSDLLPEVMIGRISVNSSSDISNVINKTIAYEKASHISSTGTDWYETSALCGDPSSSGQSTIITNEYIQGIMNSFGFENVQLNGGNGGYASWMQNKLSDGSLYMNYRGYYGVSGFGSSNINNANNGYMTPFATFITCGTGDFDGTSLSESFLRAGSATNPEGAVASVGTSTTGTHTAFNNIVDMGVYDGIFSKGLETAGAAVANGRLSLYWTYPTNPSSNVSIFSHWTNLMGDPALHLWTDTPVEMEVELASQIGFGTNFIEVEVNDVNGIAVADAKVTLIKGDDEIFTTVLTNDLGIAFIGLDYISGGDVSVTVVKQNYIPVENIFTINDDGLNIDESLLVIDDDNSGSSNGNGNGILNPGETIELLIPLRNYSSSTITGVQASLTTHSEIVNIYQTSSYYGSVAPNETTDGIPFVFSVNESAIHLEELELFLEITTDGWEETYEAMIPLNLIGGYAVVQNYHFQNSDIQPGESGSFDIVLRNKGEYTLEGVNVEIMSASNLVDVIEGESYFGDIGPNQNATSNSYFSIQTNGNTINGTMASVQLHITSDNGYDRVEYLDIQIGEVSQDDPLGPDNHGYYIYDSGDLGYNLAPIYDWIEISPDYGGNGTNLNISDNGNGNGITNSSKVVNLPFNFTFYGQDYNQITVCSNGWIAMGESNMESFRNYPIPGAGGPSPMIAAFWDDLKNGSNGDVYKYYDDNKFIIEWSNMRTYNNNSTETFQVILYDNSFGTPSGDNEIKIQYKTFNNTSAGNYSGYTPTHGCYSTIGIENQYSNVALQYSFDNSYPTAAMPLGNQTAIFITTNSPIETMMGDTNQDGGIDILDIVMVVNAIINSIELEPMGVYVSDMDGNGSINILDVIQIINIILES